MPSHQPQRLLVSGGRGRLAALIADNFQAPDHEVVLYSRRADETHRVLHRLLDPAELAGADVVLHLAWSTLPATAEQTPGPEDQHDLPYLEKLLAALASLPAAQRPLLVFLSSGGAVYGNAPGRPSREDDTCRPIGRYAKAKLAAEEMIRTAAAHHGLPGTILRVSNPYGYPVPSGRVQGIIPHAIRAAAEGSPLTLWGDGSARKDFIHYTDFLGALRAVLARKLTGTFNLGAGESHSLSEILDLVTKHTGRKISTVSTPAAPWDVQDSRLDISRLQAATGWRPRTSLDEGIRRSTAGSRPPCP
ncbi:MAG: NAD-dependent epimerase/dehydratase family protein [Verrucomicrobiota bacterium]|nr:NAD-dependent epimerase/dehydratase family protein [Verrucomicrobiota bacterium]